MGSLDVLGFVPDGQYYDAKGNVLTINTRAVNYPSATVGDQATPVVSAVAGKKIRVLAMALSSSINGPSCFLRSGAAGTQISETILRNITGSTSAMNYQRSAYYPIHLYETAVGSALVLNCSAVGVASVQVVYVLV
jgi:anaerobic glycerol-3-phosphate dehydrogenase